MLSSSAEEMAEQVKGIPALSRHACRHEAVTKYSDRVIAKEYVSIYEGLARQSMLQDAAG
jgi:hypothetical protein